MPDDLGRNLPTFQSVIVPSEPPTPASHCSLGEKTSGVLPAIMWKSGCGATRLGSFATRFPVRGSQSVTRF